MEWNGTHETGLSSVAVHSMTRAPVSSASFIGGEFVSVRTPKSASVVHLQPTRVVAPVAWGPFLFTTTARDLPLTVVDAGTVPFPSSFVLVYRCATSVFVRSLEFSLPVLALQATETHLFVFLAGSLEIVDTESGQAAGSVERRCHAGALGAAPTALVFADDTPAGSVVVASVPGFSVERWIASHKGGIQCFAVSPDGTLVATASTTGTLIRVATGGRVAEFRCGHCASSGARDGHRRGLNVRVHRDVTARVSLGSRAYNGCADRPAARREPAQRRCRCGRHERRNLVVLPRRAARGDGPVRVRRGIRFERRKIQLKLTLSLFKCKRSS